MQVFLTLENYLKLQDDLAEKLSYIQTTIDSINSNLKEATTALVDIYKKEYQGDITKDNYVMFKAKVDSQLEVIAAVQHHNLEVERKLLLEVGDSISMNSLLMKHVHLYVDQDNVEVVETAMKHGMGMLVDLKKQILESISKDSCEV